MSESAPTAADEASRPYDATFASSSTLDMSIDEQLGKAEGFKGEGNQAYERDRLTEALGKWHMALLHCAGINSFASMYGARSTEAENERAAGITSAVYNNMAACYLKQAKWDKAVYASSKALALAPKNLKALYRRAEAYLELGRNQLAARDIDLALDLRPEAESIEVLRSGNSVTGSAVDGHGALLKPTTASHRVLKQLQLPNTRTKLDSSIRSDIRGNDSTPHTSFSERSTPNTSRAAASALTDETRISDLASSHPPSSSGKAAVRAHGNVAQSRTPSKPTLLGCQPKTRQFWQRASSGSRPPH
ncbi:hypothetical protein L1887_43418 [Cichorium endivia]|nr:hypothetical protein L1887_43418 [Cichorium endivia]